MHTFRAKENLLSFLRTQSQIEQLFVRFGSSSRRLHALLLLMSINPPNGLTVSQIAEELQIKRHTCTELLKRMEAQGQIIRIRDNPDDEREVRAKILEDGKSLVNHFLNNDYLELVELINLIADV